MYSLSDLSKLKGYKIRIVTAEGEYEGVVRNFHVTMDQVTLEKVFIMPKRDPIGTLNFFMYELKSCKIVQEPKDVHKKSSSKNESKGILSNVVDYGTLTVDTDALKRSDKHGFFSTRHANRFEGISDYFADSDDTNVEAVRCEAEEEEEFVLSLPKYLGSNLPLDWLVISEINDDFFDAIKHINQESVVAVSFEGQSIGRSGKLSLIGISTRFCTFLFDILVLQNEAFQKGLKRVFENPRLQKVIHDCRQASDALFHQYQTSLVNIFDTQVADVFVNLHRSKNGKVRPNVASLTRCIQSYLNFREVDIYPEEADCHALKAAVDWMCRPVNNAMKEVAIKNIILLRELRSVLLDLMLLSYTQTVDVYLRVLQNATAEELELNPSSPNLLPEAILMNGLHVIRCKEFTEAPIFPSSASAFYKNHESDVFEFVLNNRAKDVTAKRNLKISSRPQKKRRSASNRPVRQCDFSLSSEGEEVVNNEKRKPKRLSHRLRRSINSEGRAGAVDKEVSCAFQPKSVPDNAAIENISHISKLTLKDHQAHPLKPSAGDSLRSVHPVREAQPASHLKNHLHERICTQPMNMKELKSAKLIQTDAIDTTPSKLLLGNIFPDPDKDQHDHQETSHLKSVLDSVCLEKSTPISEVKLKDHPDHVKSSTRDSSLRCSWPVASQVTMKLKDHLPESSTISNHYAKKVKIKYIPAGMLM